MDVALAVAGAEMEFPVALPSELLAALRIVNAVVANGNPEHAAIARDLRSRIEQAALAALRAPGPWGVGEIAAGFDLALEICASDSDFADDFQEIIEFASGVVLSPVQVYLDAVGAPAALVQE